MLQDIPNLGHPDPKISKAAALNIINHVSKNEGELTYLIKRLVNGMESVKVSTRKGCYTMLTVLLSLEKLDPAQLHELMQKSLITNKQTTKKERRLTYTARILCTGAILVTTPPSTFTNNLELLRSVLHDLVDLCKKKPSYFLLGLPFLTRFFSHETMDQCAFDGVWDTISRLWADDDDNCKKKVVSSNDDDDDADNKNDDDEEVCTANEYACRVQLGLVCKQFDREFECLNDVRRICKALLASQLQFPDMYLSLVCKHLSDSTKGEDPEQQQREFFSTLLNSIKPTQFPVLCTTIEQAVKCEIPLQTIISKDLVKMLMGVFKLHDPEFTAKSKKTLKLLLLDFKSLPKKKKHRRVMLDCLFGGEPPNVLHEYKVLHPIIRGFLTKLDPPDLDHLIELGYQEIGSNKLSLRMTIVWLQFLGKIAGSTKVSDAGCFGVCKKLLNIALGHETVELMKDVEEEEHDHDDARILLRDRAKDTLRSILSGIYKFQLMDMFGEYLSENFKDLTTNPESLKLLKGIKKASKKVEDQHLRYILWSYGVQLLLEESQVLSTCHQKVGDLIHMAKGKTCSTSELVKFVVDNVLAEENPPFSYEEMWKKLLVVDGSVTEDVIQVLGDVIDVVEEEGEEDDQSDDDDDDREVEVGGPKRMKLELLKEGMMQENDDDDDEESIDLENATEEDMKKMDGALAKVFAVKKSMKSAESGEQRTVLRTLRLVETYVNRHVKKPMPVSSLLMLLMPTVNLLKSSLKQRNPAHQQLTTRAIAVLDSLNRVRRFSGVDDVVEGTFATVAEELYGMASARKFRVVRELLEHAVVLVTKCYVLKGGGGLINKKEGKRFLKLYFDAVDRSKRKLRKRKKRGDGGGGSGGCSRFVRYVLDTFKESWGDGVRLISERVATAS